MSSVIRRFSYSVAFGYFRQMFFVFCLSSLLAPQLFAQSPAQMPAKRALTFQDFDSRRSLQGTQISRDGKFAAYVMQPQDGDGEVFVRNTVTDAEWRSPRGYRQPTPSPDPLNFSADGTFLFFIIEPDKADLLKARKDKKRLEDFPKNWLGIMNTATGQVTRIEQVENYQISENDSVFDAILNEPAKEDKKPADKKKEYGSALILRSLIDGNERAFADVSEYTFSKDAKSLVYAVSSQKEANNGVFAVVPQTGVAPVSLLSGAGKYQKLTWDEKQTQLAFIGDTNDASAKQPKFKVYHWLRAAPNAAEAVSVKTANFPLGYVVSEKAVLNFSADGRRLFVGTAPEPEANPNDAVPDGEKVTVDL